MKIFLDTNKLIVGELYSISIKKDPNEDYIPYIPQKKEVCGMFIGVSSLGYPKMLVGGTIKTLVYHNSFIFKKC